MIIKKPISPKKGDLIKPPDILVLKTLGIKSVEVKKKIKIIFFATGNEITNKDIPNWKVEIQTEVILNLLLKFYH